jgi:hypothetical protein
MTFDEFVDALHEAGWRGVGDAQHEYIAELWRQLRIEKYREALAHIELADDVEEAWELAREALEENK